MKPLLTILIYLASTQLFAGIADSGKVYQATTLTVSLTVVNSTCQKPNGKIIIHASGGVAPYQYENVTTAITSQTPFFNRLIAGAYTIKVTDAIGQAVTQNATITNLYAEPQAHLISKTNPSGCTSFDASLTIQGTNGLAPYTYTLDGYNFQTNNTFTNLTAGSYRYEVKDANGCLSYYIWTSNFPEIIPNNCTMYSYGSGGGGSCNPLYLEWEVGHVFGGTEPYIYSKDGINYQTSNRFDSVPVGIFTVWIKDATGLISVVSTSRIDEHYDCLPFHVSTITQAALCGQNGSITATAAEGIPPYQYSLDGINFQASNQFTGLAPGNYTVTVKDSLDITSAVLANVPNNCVVVTPTTTSSTCGNSNGKITAQGSNGTAPYQYSLDGVNYSANNIFTNLTAANYTVYVKDATGATGKANVIISNIAGPQIDLVNTTATGCDNHSGSIAITATNGTAPLSYSIDGSNFQLNPIFNGIAQGNYTVTVKDANGCIATQPAMVTLGVALPVVNLGNDSTLCEGNTVLLDATNTNSTYMWQDNSTNATYLVNKAGKYFVTVNKQGCIAKDTININYNLKPQFTLGANSRICQGSTIILDPQLSGVSYLWQDGSTAPTYTVTQPGLYSLTASNNCGPSTATVTIGNGVCNLYVPNSFTPNGDGKNDLFKAGYGDNVTEFHLQVLNRYGQIVFETRDKNKGWDGSFKGTKQPADNYVWLIRYKTVTENKWQQLKGTVMVIR